MTELTLLLLAGLAAAVTATVSMLGHRRYAHAAVAVSAVVLCGWGLSVVAPWLTLALIVGLAAVGAVRWSRSSAVVARWGARSRRHGGTASMTDIARVGSAVAMRRKAPVVRPSLRHAGCWARARTRTTEVALPLARVGLLRVWSSIEDVILVFGAPRSGKSVWLIGRILDAPGAALVTSTRLDLYQETRGLRQRRRGPVFVFNPAGLGNVESTVRFDPLLGCADPVTATQRAADMLGAGSWAGDQGGDGQRWRELAEGVLATLVHAAALGGLSMRTVAEWVAEAAADDDGARREVTSLLRRSPEPGYVATAEQFFATNSRTKTSITTTLQPTLRWLLSPPAVAATETGTPLDVAQLLEQRGTVYLLGAKETHTAPLVAALTGHIAREARRLAALAPGGRLDPPLTLALDEAHLICPVPLDDWTSDMGGRGVTIIACFQSRAQLIHRWGATAAAVILNNAGACVIFGGGNDFDDHEHWSKLAGERDEPVTTRGPDGTILSTTVRKVPVLAAAQLRNLRAWRVLVLRRGLQPVIGRVARTWRRWDVRAQHRAERTAARHAEQHRAEQPADQPAPGARAGEPAGAVPEPRRVLRVPSTRADRP